MASGVEFDEDKFMTGARPQSGVTPPGSTGTSYNYPSAGAKEPPMVKWLMNHGLAKSARAAQTILVGIVILNIIITFIVIKFII